MARQGALTAEFIRSGSRSYAAGAVLRQGVAAGDGSDGPSFEDLVADSESRLLCLAEALSVDRPEIFHEFVRWSKITHAARGLPESYLEEALAALRQELLERLPSGDGDLAAGYLADAEELLPSAPSVVASYLEGSGPSDELARLVMLALLESRRTDAAQLVVGALDDGVPIDDLYDLLVRVQAEVGRMWQMGEIGVAEEHAASRIVEAVLVHLQTRLPVVAGNGRTVVLSTVGGDLHDIGPRIVADRLEMAGWRVVYLGANTPTDDLLDAVEQGNVDLLAISGSVGQSISAVAEQIAAARRRFDKDCPPILVGGRVFCAVDDLWKTVGADGFAATAADASVAAAKLVPTTDSPH